MTTKRTRRRVQLSRISEPDNVTLTKTPANRTGFKVMRSAEAESEVERAENYLVSIEMPEDISEEEALELSKLYGLDEGYELKKRNNRYVLERTDEANGETTKVKMANGATAVIENKVFQRSEEILQSTAQEATSEEKPLNGVRIVSLRFDREVFDTPAKVDEWLTSNMIAYPANGVEQDDSEFVVMTSEADDETREVQYGTGVKGVICRSEDMDVPQALYGKTMEQAYGSYGWGQLDFAAAMMDQEFSEYSRTALRTLEEVLYGIMFHSESDLDTRKQLMLNALNGYASFMLGMIDSLPTTLLEYNRSEEPTSKQEAEMVTKSKVEEKESGAAPEVTEGEATEVVTERSDDDKPVTRSELAQLVSEAVTAAMTAKQAEAEAATEVEESTEVTRSEEAPEVPSTDATLASIADTMAKMSDAIKVIPGLVEKVESLRSDFEQEVNGTTVTRSTGESSGTETAQKAQRKDDSDEAIFGGLITDRLAI